MTQPASCRCSWRPRHKNDTGQTLIRIGTWVIAVAVFVFAATERSLAQTVTVTVDSIAVTFPLLVPGTANNQGAPGINVTTQWQNLSPGAGSSLSLYVYFSSSNVALAHTDPFNSTNIPSSAVQASINGGARQPFTGSVALGAPNAGLRVFQLAPVTGGMKNGVRTDNILLNIDLTTMPQLPADTYQGTLHFQAQAL